MYFLVQGAEQQVQLVARLQQCLQLAVKRWLLGEHSALGLLLAELPPAASRCCVRAASEPTAAAREPPGAAITALLAVPANPAD